MRAFAAERGVIPLLNSLSMNRFELGHLAWPILVRHAEAKQTIFYSDLAAEMGYSVARPTRAALWSIQDYCIERNLPALTSIVINKRTGRPGAGFKQAEFSVENAQSLAFAFDWRRVEAPFDSNYQPVFAKRARGRLLLNASTFAVSDTETLVNGRGPYQDRFRRLLASVYSDRCALCDTRHSSQLVAAHIVPWSEDSKNRLNPQNGILLCRVHDAAFECGLMRISIRGEVSFETLDVDSLGADLATQLKNSGKALRRVEGRYSPAPEFLRWRLSRGEA